MPEGPRVGEQGAEGFLLFNLCCVCVRYSSSNNSILLASRMALKVRFFFFFFSIPFTPEYYLRPSFLSPTYVQVVVTYIRGHTAGSSPLPTTVRALHFYRGNISALSSLVDSRRIVLTPARRSQQLILFFTFYKKLKNVSCEYNRLNGWNSTLQAAWYIRRVRIIWFLWTKPTIWSRINTQFYTWYRPRVPCVYPYEGYRSVTPLNAARVNRTIFHNHSVHWYYITCLLYTSPSPRD